MQIIFECDEEPSETLIKELEDLIDKAEEQIIKGIVEGTGLTMFTSIEGWFLKIGVPALLPVALVQRVSESEFLDGINEYKKGPHESYFKEL